MNEHTGSEQSDSRDREGMFCIDNIVYADGRWERPFYTMDAARAWDYWGWLLSGGWCPRFQQFQEGEWRDMAVQQPDARP